MFFLSFIALYLIFNNFTSFCSDRPSPSYSFAKGQSSVILVLPSFFFFFLSLVVLLQEGLSGF